MRKKIALFIIGAVLSIGTFLIYQHLTGATFSSSHRPVATGGALSNEERPPTFESRRPNGELEYVLSTKKAVPSKDANGNVIQGQYDLTKPTGSYYTDDGKLMYIRADTGVMSVDETAPGKSGSKPVPKGGHLSGHVVLTYGPRESFSGTSEELQPGQLQVRFEQDLDLNYAEQLLTSPGLVHLRSDQLEFDGENLTIAFNRGMKRIELLRIDPLTGNGKNNYMLIKNVGRDALGMDDSTPPDKTPSKPAPANPAATTDAPPQPVVPPPADGTAPATGASATGPAPEKRISYKLSFGKNVTATMGQRSLTSDQLFVLFSPASPGEAKGGNATQSASSTPAAANSSGTISSTPPPAGPTTSPDNSTAAAAPTPPTSPPKGDDLEVRWTGPMEMRPTTDTDLQLVDRHDVALEALGTSDRPVIVKDPSYSATAGRLWFHRAEQRFELEPNGLPDVLATDVDPAHPTFGAGKLICQGLSYLRDSNLVHLKGPGSVEMPSALIGRNTQPGEKPLTAKWQQQLDIELANLPAAKGLENTHRTLRHLVFTGPCDITSSDFHIDANALDVLVANAGVDAKGSAKSVPEHVLATGNVHLKYPHQQGGSIDDSAKPDGLNANRVELLTVRPAAGAAPVPAALLADENVEAWSYAPHREDGKDNGRLDKQTIYTPKLNVALEQGATANAAPAENGTGLGRNVKAKSLVASDGVIVELEGFQPETINATGRTLTVTTNALQGRDLATAVIDGEGMPDGSIKFAQLTEGENKIGGEHILLDQHSRTISIPGRGQFDFIQPAEKGKPATPVQVTWSRKMDFDGRTLLARFFGNIDAHIHDRPDEQSQLTCTDELDVQLNRAGKDPATGVAGKGGLKSLRATGHVIAYGITFDPNDTRPDRKPLTGLRIQDVDLMTYDDAGKRLDIPGSGKLAVTDHRPLKPGETSQDNRGDTRFDWGSGLTYDGAKNLITFTGDVYMFHLPEKPLKALPGTPTSTPKTGTAQSNPPIELSADQLTAKLLAKDPTRTGAANPLEIGSGTEQKLEWVQALGTPTKDAELKMGEDSIIVRTLTFDALHNLARGIAAPDGVGELTRPGEAMVNFQKVEWDLTKNENAFIITGATGGIQQ